METEQEVKKWVRTMGYTGEIPESLSGICNSSTSFIWEQLIKTVQPKDVAENIRTNIILQRLKTKSLDRQNEFPNKMESIEMYRRKLKSVQELKILRDANEQKLAKLNRLSQSCKLKEATVDFLKKKISQNEQRTFLLNLKKKQLLEQHEEATGTLTTLNNVTPVEIETSHNTRDITDTLEKCAEKLGKVISNNLKTTERNAQFQTSLLSKTTKKATGSNTSSIATYMALREKEDFEDISRYSTRKKSVCSLFDSATKPLVLVPEIIIENCENTLNNESKDDSLGLLPDSVSPIESYTFTKPKVQVSTIHECSDSDDSVIFNFKNKEKPKPQNIPDKLRQGVYDDKNLNTQLSELLHSTNRQLVYKALQKRMENLKVEFIQAAENSSRERALKINEGDIAQLHFIHIQTELNIIQQEKVLKNIRSRIAQKRAMLLNQVGQGDLPNFEDTLDNAIKQAKLDASLSVMKKEIDALKTEDDQEESLELIQARIQKIRKEMAFKLHQMKCVMEELSHAHSHLVSVQQCASQTLWHLKMSNIDSDWMNPLLDNRWSKEMKEFETFPMEYQRRCTFTDGKTYYRDLCIENYANNDKMQQEDLQILCKLLDSPFTPPETFLLSILKEKQMLELLKTFQNRSSVSFPKKYSDALLKQESYLSYAIERLQSIMHSTKAHKTLSVGERIEQCMQLWAEMPMKNFISSKRLFNGQTYGFYQTKLEKLL